MTNTCAPTWSQTIITIVVGFLAEKKTDTQTISSHFFRLAFADLDGSSRGLVFKYEHT